MNRKTADRIIVKSNARMKMVLDWYYENKHWLDREPFLAPMNMFPIRRRKIGSMSFSAESWNGIRVRGNQM